MGADYDISTVSGFKNLLTGGLYKTGEITIINYGYTYTLLEAPEFIYPIPEGPLSSNSIQLFIDNGALSGDYNGNHYDFTGWYKIIEIPYKNGQANYHVAMRAYIDNNVGHLTRFTIAIIDHLGTAKGGDYGEPFTTRMLENPRTIYLYMYKEYLQNDPSSIYFWVNISAWNDRYASNHYVIPAEEYLENMLNNHFKFPYANASMDTKQYIDGVYYNPEEIEEPAGSIEEGGDGDYDTDSDDIDFSTLPVISGVGSGLVTMYNPTVTQLKAFSNYLWANDVFSTLQKFIQSPMDLIISLAIVPVAVPTTDNPEPMKIGGIDTGASAYKVTSQYMTFDCGEITLNEFYGSALDYGNYTKLSIYLPYIGVRELKTDEVMGGTVRVKYNIDLLTGACVAMVKCTRQMLSSVLYSYEGNLSAQLPIQSKDYMSLYSSIARGVVDTAVNGFNPVGMVQSALHVMSSKPQVNRSGSLSANGGHLGLHTPYIIIERAIQSLPDNASMFYGYPSNITATLGSLSGYTEVDYIIETDIHCTLDEFEEINTLLKEGVYL